MPELSEIFKSKPARILSVVLIAQAALFYTISHGESVPLSRPLKDFPSKLGDWQLLQEGFIEKEVQDVLRADDTLTRIYASPGTRAGANLFVAYFKTQRTGQAPHSPKNCLPGSGWEPSQNDVVQLSVPGEPRPLQINRYIVSKGDEKSLVLYWYQSRDRVIASEYSAKFWLVADAIRYNRTDTALVRVVIPVLHNEEAEAMQTATRFVQSFFPTLRQYLPS